MAKASIRILLIRLQRSFVRSCMVKLLLHLKRQRLMAEAGTHHQRHRHLVQVSRRRIYHSARRDTIIFSGGPGHLKDASD